MRLGGWTSAQGEILLAGGDPDALLARPARYLAAALSAAALREMQARLASQSMTPTLFNEQRRLALGLPEPPEAKHKAVPEDLADMAHLRPDWWKED